MQQYHQLTQTVNIPILDLSAHDPVKPFGVVDLSNVAIAHQLSTVAVVDHAKLRGGGVDDAAHLFRIARRNAAVHVAEAIEDLLQTL